jgi:hypothetical protein
MGQTKPRLLVFTSLGLPPPTLAPTSVHLGEALLSRRHRHPGRLKVAAVGVGTSASLAGAALLSACMKCHSDSSWRRISNDVRRALYSAVASSVVTSSGRPA